MYSVVTWPVPFLVQGVHCSWVFILYVNDDKCPVSEKGMIFDF